jgi:Leucine-rich repeat (LRR) protein
MLTEEYILKLTGAQTVDGITSISLTVDTSYQSLLNLGDIMPNLRHLALDNSNLYTIRDLGTSVRNLLSISLNSCRLTDLDGIGMFAALKELSLQNNQISDITALAMHESIEVSFCQQLISHPLHLHF